MPNLFTIIGTSWNFFRTHPVLNEVLLLMIILPMSALFSLGEVIDRHPAFQEEVLSSAATGVLLLSLVLEIVLCIVIVWGMACFYTVGKRLLQSKAGRSRTSGAQVRKEAKKYIVSLLFTDILRDCIAILWIAIFIVPLLFVLQVYFPDAILLFEGYPEVSMHPKGLLLVLLFCLLLVPGIIYYTRTTFFAVIVTSEDKMYRSALNESNNIVRGKTWSTFFAVLGLIVILFIPSLFFVGLIEMIGEFDPRLIIALNIASAALLSFSSVIYALSSIVLYKEIKGTPSSKLSKFLHVWNASS